MADPFSFLVSFAVGSLISFLFPAQGPRLTDLSVSASTYGNPVPWVWGGVRVGGNMIWSSSIIEHKSKKKAGIGQFYTQYTYSANFAMAFCKGPCQQIRRIWANGRLIYDATGTSKNVNNGLFQFTFYPGDENQMPDPIISAAIGITNTPAYRGTCYVVFNNFDLSRYFGNQIPQIAAEIYTGNSTNVPNIEFTQTTESGQTPFTSYQGGQMAVDYTRGFYYLTGTGAYAGCLVQMDLATGQFVAAYSLSLPPDDYWDTGKFTQVAAVTNEGDIVCIFGGLNNEMKLGLVDHVKFSITATIGTSTPFSTPGININFSPAPYYLDSTGDNFLAVSYGSFGGKLAYGIDKYLDTNTFTTFGPFGDLYHSMTVCGVDTAAWAIAYTDTTTGVGCILEAIAMGNSPYNGWTGPTEIANPNGGTGLTPVALIYDNSTNGVILATQSTPSQDYFLSKISLDDGSTVWSRPMPVGFPWAGFRASNLVGGTLAYTYAGKLFILNTSDGSMVNRDPDQAAYTNRNWLNVGDVTYSNPGEAGYAVSPNPGTTMEYYDGISGQLVVMAGGGDETSMIINANSYDAENTTLQQIVEDLLTQGGFLPDQFNMGALGSTVIPGYGFAKTTDIKSILGELQEIFLFDIFEQDGQLVGVMRGGTVSVETISYKALASPNGGQDEFWKETRLSEADLPASVNLKYMNTEQDYEQNTAISKRILAPIPTMFSRQQDNVEASVAFDATTAKNQANKMLNVAWAERTKHDSVFPLAYSYLEPSDLITVNLADGRSYFERITRTELGANFNMSVETAGQDSGAYISTLVGDSGSGVGQTVQSPVPALPFIFNTPYLRDVDNGGDGSYSIYYNAVGNDVRTGFNGATLFTSPDGGNYDILSTFSNDLEYGAVIGTVPDAACGWFGLDWKTKITTRPAITAFALEAITDDELAAGANLCIIGNEVLQFRDCQQNTDGSWTIWNLWRGRRGTEWACGTHAANEYFAFMSNTTVGISQEPLDSGGKNYWFKAVGIGMDIASAKTLQITYVPRDLMPYAPVQLVATWNNADIDLTFQRRTRFGGNMVDGTGIVPLNQATEAYEVDVYDADGNILRTLSVNNGTSPAANPVVVYPAALIATDFASTPGTITVAIYQIGITGRGFGTKATLKIVGTASPTARYWGASSNTTLTEAQILALGNEDLATNFINSVNYNCTGGLYPYYAFPESYGTPANVLVNSLPFSDFTVTTETVGGENYFVIRFNRIQHGASIPVTWQ